MGPLATSPPPPADRRAPLVSIILPTYNGARYLESAVRSCLDQSHTDLELIVVVDGSTDHSEALLAGIHDPRLVVHTKPNGGLPRALNTGFSLARGRYWTWTSDDNLYLPDALAVMVEHLAAHPRTPMVCTDVLTIDDDSRVNGYSNNTWACFLYTADAAQKAGPYRPEFQLVEDVDFFLRLEHRAGKIDRIQKPHYQYRLHNQSLSHKQFARRQLASLKLHCDLVEQGIERLDLRRTFIERLDAAAIHRRFDLMSEMLEFARDKHYDFYFQLAAHDRFLRSRTGWLYNRARIAAKSRIDTLSQRLNLLSFKLRPKSLQ